MTIDVTKLSETLTKYSSEYFDTLEWEAQEELPDFCVRNGDPTMRISTMVGDGLSAGSIAAWSCDKDGFTYTGIPAAEAAFLLEGVARLTEASTGNVIDVRAGEGYHLPVGWAGSWEALEPVRKLYFFL
jgi:uncharacterized cupin superfamily protein